MYKELYNVRAFSRWYHHGLAHEFSPSPGSTELAHLFAIIGLECRSRLRSFDAVPSDMAYLLKLRDGVIQV